MNAKEMHPQLLGSMSRTDHCKQAAAGGGGLLAQTPGPTGPALGRGKKFPGQESEMTFLKRMKGQLGRASSQMDQ